MWIVRAVLALVMQKLTLIFTTQRHQPQTVGAASFRISMFLRTSSTTTTTTAKAKINSRPHLALSSQLSTLPESKSILVYFSRALLRHRFFDLIIAEGLGCNGTMLLVISVNWHSSTDNAHPKNPESCAHNKKPVWNPREEKCFLAKKSLSKQLRDLAPWRTWKLARWPTELHSTPDTLIMKLSRNWHLAKWQRERFELTHQLTFWIYKLTTDEIIASCLIPGRMETKQLSRW